MPATVTIPLTTLPAGTYSFPATGGQAIADTDSKISLLVNRNVTGGLDSASGVTVSLSAYVSFDSGVTWRLLGACTIPSGIQAEDGVRDTQSGFYTTVFPGTNRLVRATVTVTGGSVAVSGTLTVS